MEAWWTPSQAAKVFEVSPSTIYRWCELGTLKSNKVRGRVAVRPVGHQFTVHSLAVAAKYSEPYIRRLAREGKIRSRLYGRRLHITMEEAQRLMTARLRGNE